MLYFMPDFGTTIFAEMFLLPKGLAAQLTDLCNKTTSQAAIGLGSVATDSNRENRPGPTKCFQRKAAQKFPALHPANLHQKSCCHQDWPPSSNSDCDPAAWLSLARSPRAVAQVARCAVRALRPASFDCGTLKATAHSQSGTDASHGYQATADNQRYLLPCIAKRTATRLVLEQLFEPLLAWNGSCGLTQSNTPQKM